MTDVSAPDVAGVAGVAGRSSEQEGPMSAPTYTIELATVGTQWVPGAEVYYLRDFEDWQPLWFTMAVLRGGGHTIVLNTGFGDDFARHHDAWLAWHPRSASSQRDDERAAAVLSRLGVDPGEVDELVLTPLGGYALGDIDLFPNARISFSRTGWERLFSPPRGGVHHAPAAIFPRRQLDHLLFDAWDRVHLLDDQDTIAPGIRTVRTGAHHPSSLSVFVDTAAGVACYSDSYFTYRNVEERLPLGIARTLDESVDAIDLARREADIILPAYDPILFDRYPDGRVGF